MPQYSMDHGSVLIQAPIQANFRKGTKNINSILVKVKKQDGIHSQGPTPPPWRFLYLRETNKFVVWSRRQRRRRKKSVWRPTLPQGAWVKTRILDLARKLPTLLVLDCPSKCIFLLFIQTFPNAVCKFYICDCVPRLSVSWGQVRDKGKLAWYVNCLLRQQMLAKKEKQSGNR